MKKITFLLNIFILISCKSQNYVNMKLPNINNSSEVFDLDVLVQKIDRNSKKTEKYFIQKQENSITVTDNNHNTLLYYSKTVDKGSLLSGYDYTENPLFGTYKQFYPNNILKTKGLFCWFGFKLGKWYSYDDKGNLISMEDFDEGFEFTYEDVFLFCRENSIPLEKTSDKMSVQINKLISSNLNLWNIIYPDYNIGRIKSIQLNGANGKIEREFDGGEIPRN